MKLKAGTFFKYNEDTIKKCKEHASYQPTELSVNYWTRCAKMLSDNINMNVEDLSVNQRNWITNIISGLKAEGMI